MSDIHIGKSPYDRVKDQIRVEIFFHVPNNGGNNAYPGLTQDLDSAGNPIPVSIAPGVTEQEKTDLEAGSLYEVIPKAKLFSYDGSAERKAEIKTEIRGMWADIASEKQAQLDNDYPFYGITLAKA